MRVYVCMYTLGKLAPEFPFTAQGSRFKIIRRPSTNIYNKAGKSLRRIVWKLAYALEASPSPPPFHHQHQQRQPLPQLRDVVNPQGGKILP